MSPYIGSLCPADGEECKDFLRNSIERRGPVSGSRLFCVYGSSSTYVWDRSTKGVSTDMIIADLNNIARIHGGRTIFSAISWSLQEGEKIGLVGPNGIGKSTLLRTLAGIEPPDGGAVTLRRGARVAYLPQEYSGEPGRAVMAELLAAREDLA